VDAGEVEAVDHGAGAVLLQREAEIVERLRPRHPAAVVGAVAAGEDDRLAGPVLWALEDAPEVLRAFREFVASAPPEVATAVTLRRAPPAPFLPVELHRRPVCLVGMLALAPPEAAERLLAPMRGLGRPLLDLVKRRPYGGLPRPAALAVPGRA